MKNDEKDVRRVVCYNGVHWSDIAIRGYCINRDDQEQYRHPRPEFCQGFAGYYCLKNQCPWFKHEEFFEENYMDGGSP